MPRVKTHVARFDTYTEGRSTPSLSTKSGFRRDRSHPANENDKLFCPKGETYYSWKFQFGASHRSRTRPRPSQLTQSDFLSQIYGISEEIEDVGSIGKEELASAVGEWVGRIEELGSECEEKLMNMPEQLHDAPSGELLQSRVESCEEMAGELEGVDFSDLEEAEIEPEDTGDDDDDTEAEDTGDEVQEAYERIVEEISIISYQGE